jgi:hypothetical protein
MTNYQVSSDQLESFKVFIPTICGLAGVVFGILITTISNWKLRTKETKLRLIEKTFDRRINAHEDILRISELLRTTVSTYVVDNDHNLITYPGILQSHEMFDNFLGKFYDLTNSNTHWISIELFREINYIQDYLSSLSIQIKDKDDKVLPEIAILIKQDIIDLSGNLERQALRFFSEDLPKLKRLSNSGWHKYDLRITEKRLMDCLLMKNLSIIQKM